ncbi:MAG TPA: hypothetical protein VF862_11550 [Gemmatimonadales bacterium]
MTIPTLPPPDEAPLPFDLRTIGIAMRARGRALAVVLLAALAIGVTGGLTVGKREYAADTVLLHRPIRAGGQETGTADSLPLQTQANLVKVRANLEETRKRLGLGTTLEQLGAAVSVTIQKNTSLLVITARWDDPAAAAGISNTLRDVFLANQARLQYRDDLAVAQYLLRETTLRKQMLDAQVVSLDGVIANLQGRVARERQSRPDIESLSDLNIRIGKLREAIYDDRKIRSDAAELAVKELELERARKGLADGVISQAEFEEAKAAYEKQRIQAEDTDQIKTWKSDLQRLNGMVLPSDSKAMPSSVALQEVMVKAALLEFERVGVTEKLAQLERLRDDAEARMNAFEASIQGSGEAPILLDPRKSDFRLISEARVPTAPLKSNRRILFMMLAAFTLVAGAGAIVAREVFHGASRSAPELAARHQLDRVLALPQRADGDLVDHPEAREQIRRAAQQLLPASAGRGARILVVSAEEGEGRTTVATAVSASLGRMGTRVLLMDAGLRDGGAAEGPQVRALAAAAPGCLGSYLAGGNGDLASLSVPSEMPGVSVTAALAPASPPDVIGSPRMAALLDDARAEFDTVLIDGPPLLPYADVEALLPHVDGVLLVVNANQRTPVVRKALARLQAAGARILVTVLNRVEPAFLPLA